ncbi:hypothetical protein GCM10027426_25210 [Microbacterium lacusdiani]
MHLAGLAAVGPSFDDPMRYIQANGAMVVNMCESLIAQGRAGTRVVASSTGAVYAGTASPIDETSPVTATSPYAISKLLAEHLLSYYGRRGLSTVSARPFNHIGPHQGPGFLVPDLISRLRDLPPGVPLTTGDLTTARDYTDVRDVVDAYLLLCEAPALQHEVYNIASGRARTGNEVLAAICAAMGREVPATDMTGARPIDVASVTGDSSRLRSELGWRPAIEFENSIADAVASSA